MMNKLFWIFLVLSFSLWGGENSRRKIAVCIPIQERSEGSLQSLIESGRRHFCRLHDVHYFILSAEPPSIDGSDLEWVPMGSGRLFQQLQGLKKRFEKYHYLFIIDAKMEFVAPVGDEVFGQLIAAQKGGKPTLYSAKFFGGRPAAVFDLLKSTCKYYDYARAHSQERESDDEQILNRSFKEHPPTRILSPSYAYPENWKLDYPKKIIRTGEER